MKIFINLPTWLGDSVMASVALKLLFHSFEKAHFILYGSSVACELFRDVENTSIFIEDKKNRYLNFLKLSKKWQKFDYAFSFRSSMSAKIMLFMLSSKHKFCFDKNAFSQAHQVVKYLFFVQKSLKLKLSTELLFVQEVMLGRQLDEDIYEQNLKNTSKLFKDNSLFLPFKALKKEKILGINAGAKYGSAKRWPALYFAKVALAFASTHRIVIFGIASEAAICDEIENLLLKEGVKVLNLCAKTNIKELCEHISKLDLFITNDSGAMHIAAVYKINTLALFGPTNFKQTSPWLNENAQILSLNLSCSPCMQRTCPLKTHKCMLDLKPEMIISAGKKLLNQ